MTEIEVSLRKLVDRYQKLSISEVSLQRIAALGTKVAFQAGELIVASGDTESRLYLLAKGLVRKFYLDNQGNDLTQLFMQEGKIFGTHNVVYGGQVMCNFEAAEPCETIYFNYNKVQELMVEEPALAWVYIGLLEETLRLKLVRETALVNQNATERYQELKRMIPDIDQRVSHAHIATYIGITPVSLSRIRRTLREEV
ncbi:Crp/Fnr family transcriptional regulator [Candidatus Enterococcus ferrettii]|uniref:Cyclic nucleotide-binding domain-containing protein n=1 Tax=Candidatus Enterococcus ferrettii TaxID=2815324 RepID=A0ABV0EUU1_9ENTE|nr:Crp/Fnr family transcriptional regulator [Enterococcus sp. 665A]MBO1343156.1 Crp/Fnr family transcriptional regulator [Enterococcus sp. 665A]